MERIAQKILTMLDDVRWTHRDLDYLGWQLVHLSHKPMRKRLLIIAEAITFHHNEELREDAHYEQDTLF
jgi:hypothetical protein